MSTTCLILVLTLTLVLPAVVEGRPRPGKQNSHEFYGAYNPCKYNIWPWPTEVKCSADGEKRYLDANFRVFFSDESRAKNSSILLAAIQRYEALFSNQPVRLTRGRYVEPQYRFEGDDDDYYYGDLSSTTNRDNRIEQESVNLLEALEITVLSDHDDTPKSIDDSERYSMEIPVNSHIATISSSTIWGAIYALDTFSQVVEAGNVIKHTPLHISDTPRYPWRGFLLDTSNHYLSLDTIRKLIDGMAAVKLNVLHWHIVDSYSFPFASAVFPDLAQYGSWPSAAATFDFASTHRKAATHGTYSPSDIRDIVAYCRDRGIRVVPEMDVPGHAYSWGLSEKFRDLTVSCPRYTDELGHVDDVPLDPTREETYAILNDLFTELSMVFSDSYFHLGGDEVKYGCWNESEAIVTWMADHNIPKNDFYTLEQYFFERIGTFSTKELGRTLIAWEEVFFSDAGGTDGAHGAWVGSKALPASSTVVEAWTGPDYVEEAVYNGYDAILAYGWYLDRQTPVDGLHTWFFGDTWAQMYTVDPEPPALLQQIHRERQARGERWEVSKAALANGRRRGQALGGEISMWTEQVDDQNIESQVWPRAAAAAERLWSDQDIVDPAAAAPRLSHARCRLVSRYGIRAGPVWSDFCVSHEENK